MPEQRVLDICKKIFKMTLVVCVNLQSPYEKATTSATDKLKVALINFDKQKYVLYDNEKPLDLFI